MNSHTPMLSWSHLLAAGREVWSLPLWPRGAWDPEGSRGKGSCGPQRVSLDSLLVFQCEALQCVAWEEAVHPGWEGRAWVSKACTPGIWGMDHGDRELSQDPQDSQGCVCRPSATPFISLPVIHTSAPLCP